VDLLKSIQSFGIQLSDWLSEDNQSECSVSLRKIIDEACHYNHWFVADEIYRRLNIITSFITSCAFEREFSIVQKSKECKKIAISSEEKIPIEEFSLILTVLLSGNHLIYRINDKQDKIIPFIFEKFSEIFLQNEGAISFVEGQIRDFDKLIVTTREPWTESKRAIIAKYNTLELVRPQSVAIIDDKTSRDDLKNLAIDVFSYFGMGCGNVKKIFIPEGYQLAKIFDFFEEWQNIINYNHYANNYQYHQSVYLMNRIQHFDNGFLLLKEDIANHSPIGVLYFEYYQNRNKVIQYLNNLDTIDSIYVSKPQHNKEKFFGSSTNQLLLPSQQVIDFLV
jgi:hypothetical protein